MAYRTGTLVLFSLAILALLAVEVFMSFHSAGLPFVPRLLNAETAEVVPYPGIPLPQGLAAGDRIDIPALNPQARAALLAGGPILSNMAAGVSYRFVIRRATGDTSVSVTTGDRSASSLSWQVFRWIGSYFDMLVAGVALLALWYGRNHVARFLAVWAVVQLTGDTLLSAPFADLALYAGTILQFLFYFTARTSFYAMVEALAGEALSARTRLWLRVGFAFTLLLGLAVIWGGSTLLVFGGSAALLKPAYTWLIVAPYAVSGIGLWVAQWQAKGAELIRIRWMLWSLVLFLIGVTARDVQVFGEFSGIVQYIGVALGISGIAYAILRHRLVNVSVVIDRTLVYGATTTLVVGVVAAANSLALRATLGEGAGLLLQVVVPLALGIVLSKVRIYMDMLVEHVFFRTRYLADQALKNFARRSSHIEEIAPLLDAAAAEVSRYTRSPAVALYEICDTGFSRLREAGESRYPGLLDGNDPAVVATRADQSAVDLGTLVSRLGSDGCVFPVSVLGRLRGLLVCANRPGEHYAAYERKLITQVMSDVGAAWRILRARDNEEFVRAMAQGELTLAAAKRRAQTLIPAGALA